MPNVYAVLAGVNNYSEEPLKGCVNDILEVENWLRTNFSNNTLFVTRLTDIDERKPTRENIITAFSTFDQAADNDTCLFYFAGHGTNIGAPKEFAGDTGSGCVQALLCIDWQRNIPHQGYIIDKELSYLIWNATKNKDLNFIAITDCCHSGSNTRAFEVEGSRTRQLELLEQSKAVSEYLGFGANVSGESCYAINEEGSMVVARGPHIHIAAARDSETAKELTLKLNGEATPRGAMSLALCQALSATGGKISYTSLYQDIANRIKRFYFGAVSSYQKPVLNIYNLDADRLNQVFLTSQPFNQANNFRVYFDKEFGWCISAGRLQGLSTNDNGVLQVDDKEINFKVVETWLQQAKIDPAEPALLNTRKNYLASVAVMQQLPVNNAAERYNYLVDLDNPATNINSFEIQLEKATGVSNGKYQLVTDNQAVVNLQYFTEGNKIYPPIFQLTIKNTGTNTLYCSFAYLQSDLSIGTAGKGGFDSFQVEPGNAQSLLSPNFLLKRIKLANETQQEIAEYLKIFLSNEIPIALDSLQVSEKEATRDIETPTAPVNDWAVKTIQFVISPLPRS